MNQSEFARLIALEDDALNAVLTSLLSRPAREATAKSDDEGQLDINEVRKDPDLGRMWVKGHVGEDAFAATISPARVEVRPA
ncbi:MAG: hypothetical protein RLO50_08990 [Azospirillaceae bacterium]